MRGGAYHNPVHEDDDDDDIVRTVEQREQMSSQMTELLVLRVGSLRNVIAETKVCVEANFALGCSFQALMRRSVDP
jgi:hypothetical protein